MMNEDGLAFGQASYNDLFAGFGDGFDVDGALVGLDLKKFDTSFFDAGATAPAADRSPSQDSSSTMSPPTPSSEAVRTMRSEPVTKARAGGPGRHPNTRPRGKPQNMFNVWTNPAAALPQQYAVGGGGCGVAGGSPLMADWSAAAQMSPVMQAMNDPYAWMQSKVPRRPFGYAGSSPSLLYNPYAAGPLMGSPPFPMAAANPYMAFQPAVVPMKLPMQAAPRPAEAAEAGQAKKFAPLVLPTDLGQAKAAADELDPSAIPTAISSFLGGSAGAGSSSSNMQLYEKTFSSFVEEEARIDYGNVTVVQLKTLLRKYHLAATGKKDELIAMVKQVAAFLKKLPGSPDAQEKQQEAAGQDEPNRAASNSQQEALNLDAFLA